MGGTGKTRLALQLAAELLDNYEHGVWLVELSPLSDDRYILPTVMAIFNLRQEPGMELIETLINYLQSKHLLLLLDNCEHLVAEVARFTEIILRSTPLIKILASSREGLGVAGETINNVPSLATPKIEELPSLEILEQYDAIRLFCERAGATQPAFTLSMVNARAVAQICSRLDGIPLAIELAAARIIVLSAGVALPDILAREGIHPETPKVPFTPGWDLVGVVDRLGVGVSGFEPGQIVAAMPISGAYAEFVWRRGGHGADATARRLRRSLR